VPYGVDWWPPQNENELGGPVVDHMMGQALAEQSVFEVTCEDFPPPALETAIEERNASKEREDTIGIVSTDKTRPRMMDASAQEDSFPHQLVQKASSRIHVLGAGNVGRFVAHALASMGDPPPITLLTHRSDITRQWKDEGRTLELITGNISRRRSGIDVRHVTMLGCQADQSEKIIDKLIVTMQPKATVPALMDIKEHLLPTSTICFLQNGMGIMDDVNARIFPNPATRPRYIVGMTSHIVEGQRGRAFTTIHTKWGNTYLSIVPKIIGMQDLEIISEEPLVQRMYYGWTASSRNLMRSLTRCPILNAKGFQYGEMMQLQFERLAVNAVLSPLSVIFDCAHGKLLGTFPGTSLIRGLLREIVTVAQSVPELRRLDHFKHQFTPKRLESLIVRIASRSNNTLGPMLEDVRNGRRTDIDFVNGYIVKRGQELGIPCPINTTVIQMVKAKQEMARSKQASFIPFKDS
jgi:2-dehydropantoate 2-reductase